MTATLRCCRGRRRARSARRAPGSLRGPGAASLVLEPGGEIGQAWQAAAGMLAPQIEAHGDDPLLELGLAAREHYAPLAAELREATGIDIGLWQEGIARVARDRDRGRRPALEVRLAAAAGPPVRLARRRGGEGALALAGTDARRALGAARGRARAGEAGAALAGRCGERRGAS